MGQGAGAGGRVGRVAGRGAAGGAEAERRLTLTSRVAGSCIIGITLPDTCGIWPFHRLLISYCTSVGVMLSLSSRLALAWASASATIALARPTALMESPWAWN
jgi:hypothetical protein